MALLLTLGISAKAGEWTVDGNVVTFTGDVGCTADGTAYSGTVSLRIETVTISGQIKIVTTIVNI